jgi:hypothetical protein
MTEGVDTSSHIWILMYALFILVIQFQALYEGLRKRNRKILKPNLHATAGLILAGLFALFIVRWFLFLIACVLIPNIATTIVACILAILRLWIFLIDAFDYEGNAKELTSSRNTFSNILGFFETAFVVYFLVAYFLL